MSKQLFADRYRIESRLGVGGMAVVELAFDARLERYVAVKLLAEHLAHDNAFLSRFRREALAAARLVHPNVVQVFDFGTDSATGRQYIVMEHVDGQSCSELLREYGWINPNDAVDILTQACRGLDYAHRHRVIHRDVKPGNLMRNHDGVVKLADFGIAKAAEQSDITKMGSVLGTAAYLSPEQTRGESASPASDLYALGVVAYQLLTGRLPYESTSLPDLARQQEMGAPIPPDELNPDIPASLSAAIMRSLAGEPAIRADNAREMEQSLVDGLQGVGPVTVPVSKVRKREFVQEGHQADARTSATALVDAHAPSHFDQWSPPTKVRASSRPRSESSSDRANTSKPKPRRRALRFFAFLLVVCSLFATGVVVLQYIDNSRGRTVELKPQVEGDINHSIDTIKALISDNTS